MSSLNFNPERTDLALWRGNEASFTVTFVDAAGVPVDASGTWEATFGEGSVGKLDVDDSQASAGVLVVTVVDTAGLSSRACWQLRRADIGQTVLHGEVKLDGCC